MEPDDGLSNIFDELVAFRDQNQDMENPTIRCGTIKVKARIPATVASISMEPDGNMHFNCVKCEIAPLGNISGDSKCPNCGTCYTNEEAFSLDTACSRYSTPSASSDCRKGKINKGSLLDHIQHVHYNELKCKYCGKQFSDEKNLVEHILSVHDSPREDSVKQNDKEDIGKAALGKEVTMEPDIAEREKLDCERCGEQFHQKTKLEKHISSIHSPKKETTVDICQIVDMKDNLEIFANHPDAKIQYIKDDTALSTEEDTSLADIGLMSESVNDSNGIVDMKDSLEISANHPYAKKQYIKVDTELSTGKNTGLADFEKLSELINDSSTNTATIAELAKAQGKQFQLSFNNSASIINLSEFNRANETENVKKFESILELYKSIKLRMGGSLIPS